MRNEPETRVREPNAAAAAASNPTRLRRSSNGSTHRRVRGAGAVHTAAPSSSSKRASDSEAQGGGSRQPAYPRNPALTSFMNEMSNHTSASAGASGAAAGGTAESSNGQQPLREGASENHVPVPALPMAAPGAASSDYWSGGSCGANGKRTDGGGGTAKAMRWDGRQVLIGTTVFWSLLAIASLTIAFATDNWIHVATNQTNSTFTSMQQTRSGLWRSCAQPLLIEFTASSAGDAGKANSKGATTPATATRLMQPQESEPKCTYIWNDLSEHCKLEQDSFHSIGRFVCSIKEHSIYMRSAMWSPVVAQIVLLVASTLNAMGFCNPKRKFFTLIGGVLLMLAGIFIMIGVVVYIYFVSSEIGMKEKKKPEGHNVEYHYDLSFSLTVASFFFCEIDGVLCCYLYSRSFRTLMSMERARRSSSTLSLAAHRVTPPAPLPGLLSRPPSNPNGFASGSGSGSGPGSGSATNGALVKASSSRSLLAQTDGAVGASCSNSMTQLPSACNEQAASSGGNYLRFNSPTSSAAAPIPQQMPSPLFSPVLSRTHGATALAGAARRPAHAPASISMHSRAQSTGLLLESVSAACEPGYCVPATLSESMHVCTCSSTLVMPPPPFGQPQGSPTLTSLATSHSHYAHPHAYGNAEVSVNGGHPHGILRPMHSAHALTRHVHMPRADVHSPSPNADADVNVIGRTELAAGEGGCGSSAELMSPGGSGERDQEQLLIESPNVLRHVHITYHMPGAGCGDAHTHGGHVHGAQAQQQWLHHRSYYATTGPPPRKSATLDNFQAVTSSSATGTRLCRITQV